IHLRISDNNFDQPFPTELGNISTLQRLWFKNNNFTFDDLLPIVNYANLGNIESLWYAQQGDFITSTPFEGTEGELLEVTLDFEDTNDSNLYSWYKEGETTPQFQLTGSKTLPLDPLLNENAGLYRVEVTNPTFQQALQIFDNDNEPLVIPSANNVEIIVNEGNNPPTDITLTNDVINSDAAPGSLVGNLTTTDADPNDTHTYELTDFCIPTETNNNVLFAISENQLVLASGFSLDASLASLLVCITSTDRAGASYSKKFTIRINKINNPPTDILLTNSVIDAADAQGGFTIDELSTVDLDNPDDVHTYTLANNCEPVVPNNNDQFVIEDNELKLTTGFQYDPQVTELQICVTTTDRAQASYSKNFQITIRPTIEECVVNDKTVLEALYDALGGDSWDADARLNWKSNLPLNQWGGVTTNDDGCVTRIILEGKNLVGTIPTEIGNLSEILEINFGKNNISGTIPAAFGNLATLKILWLNENQLSGQVPLGFFNMINLTNLYLFQNNLQPPLPNELNQLTKLIVFGFDNNETKFADADFPNINNLIALERFYIQNHAFEDVPAIVNPNLLTEIGIARNKLTFEDILPYAPLTLNVFSYAPQDSVGDGGSFTVNSGENFTINLEIDQNITNNTYKWYKDGALVFEGNSNSYTVEAVEEQDAGKYTCEVTNREAPELTLYARAVTLIVTPVTPLPPPVLTAELDGNNPAERIILNWTYSLEYTPENYFIERSQGDSLNFSVINNNWNQKTYTDGDGLQAGETYFYRVKAVVNREESPYSNIAYVTTNSLPVVADIDKVGSTNVVMPFTLAEFTNAYTDVDNDPLATIQILSLPTNGRLSLGNTDLNINAEVTANEIANVVFTPDADWAGNTSFSYNSSDGYNYAANPAQVNIAIEQIEDVDLIVENPDLNTNSVAAGNDIGLSVVISTKGTVDSGSAEFVYLLSTDTIADQNDIVLKSEQIPPQQSGSVLSLNTSVTVPEDTEPGSYYIIYYVDAQEQVLEFNEINNLRTLAINIEPFREDPGIVIMNLITPNNDGLNDKLYIKNIEAYPDNEVVLLDRWGNEIFRAEGYNNEWIPVLDEDIVDFGSYVCIVKVNIDDITLEPIKRMVSIVSGNNQ
ncbi:MAG: immunoglobulin domain-containing protein, partial [Bacteroidota bacterium]